MEFKTFETIYKTGILLIVVTVLGFIMYEGIYNGGFNSGWGL